MSLHKWYDCKRCELHEEAFRHVLFNGNKDADILFISFYPDEMEDTLGVPMADREGMSIALDIVRYVSNRLEEKLTAAFCCQLCCRPKLPPTVAQWNACSEHVAEIIDMVQPRLIVLHGTRPAKFNIDTNITKVCLPRTMTRGTEQEFLAIKRNKLMLLAAMMGVKEAELGLS